MSVEVIHSDALAWLKQQPEYSYDFVYIDPPFNTGQVQRGRSGDSYADSFGAGYIDWLRPICTELWRVLTPRGSMMVHVDPHESHYVKVLLDQDVCGRDSFMNEIVWAYDYGGRPKTRWPSKHDTIFWYARDPGPGRYTYNYDAIDRIPYMAPDLVGPEKAARGKTPTDVWFHTICPTSGPERTGYPTQKPLGVLRRIIRVHTNPGDRVLDTFCGSGTTGAAAVELGRRATLVDASAEAVTVTRTRLGLGAPAALGVAAKAPHDKYARKAPHLTRGWQPG